MDERFGQIRRFIMRSASLNAHRYISSALEPDEEKEAKRYFTQLKKS